MNPHPRDAEHFHDTSAISRLRAGILVRERLVANLRFALASFSADELPGVLAEALTAHEGSKAKAFDALDAAIKEVA